MFRKTVYGTMLRKQLKRTFPGLLTIFALLLAALGFTTTVSGDAAEEYLWSGVNNGDIFDEPDDVLDLMLDHLAKTDLRVVRVWIDLRLEMDDDGEPLPVGTYNDCILEQVDDLMLKAWQKGILLLITLHQYNWISGDTYLPISEEFYEWRKCKTPENVYDRVVETGVAERVYDPYFERGWGLNYLTNQSAKNAYKLRVNHILNHVNPHFNRRWRDINEVIWAWGLQNEPEYLRGSAEDTRDWLDEMATYVKSIDPDTYVALGTMHWDWGNIEDADIYTIHWYPDEHSDDTLEADIQLFQETMGESNGKLLLMEEFNPGPVHRRHPTGWGALEEEIESIMDVCRRNGVPWMFWEFGYWYDDDDIWFVNSLRVEHDVLVSLPDGIFWEAKVMPAAKRIWRTSWDWTVVGKRWKVQEMVSHKSDPINFIDTFSGGHIHRYRFFDDGDPDLWEVPGGYLKIEAGFGEDLWEEEWKRGAPLMLLSAPPGDYWVETMVRADDPAEMRPDEPLPYPVQPINTQMGLFVFQDVDNWLFFGLTYHDFTVDGFRIRGDGLIVTKTEDGTSSIVEENGILADFMFLKIERQGDSWEFYWKTEYIHDWSFLTTLDLALTDHEVGMGVKTFDLEPQAGPANAYFDFFLVDWNVDVNGDGKVDMRDIAMAALAFGSFPSHPRWNPIADLNEDDRVDIRDIVLIARDFGEIYL